MYDAGIVDGRNEADGQEEGRRPRARHVHSSVRQEELEHADQGLADGRNAEGWLPRGARVSGNSSLEEIRGEGGPLVMDVRSKRRTAPSASQGDAIRYIHNKRDTTTAHHTQGDHLSARANTSVFPIASPHGMESAHILRL